MKECEHGPAKHFDAKINAQHFLGRWFFQLRFLFIEILPSLYRVFQKTAIFSIFSNQFSFEPLKHIQ
jgi:hypothetical protein